VGRRALIDESGKKTDLAIVFRTFRSEVNLNLLSY